MTLTNYGNNIYIMKKKKIFTPEMRERRIGYIKELRAQNFHFVDIARILQISRQRLDMICRKYNIHDTMADEKTIKLMQKKYHV